MDLVKYEKEMLRTAKKVVPYNTLPYAIAKEDKDFRTLTETKEALYNAIFGLVGETGELTDLIKKWQFHQHEPDIGKLVSELGDIHWYWSYLCYIFGLDPNAVLQGNIDKLRTRYPNGFTSEDSVQRRDVNE